MDKVFTFKFDYRTMLEINQNILKLMTGLSHLTFSKLKDNEEKLNSDNEDGPDPLSVDSDDEPINI